MSNHTTKDKLKKALNVPKTQWTKVFTPVKVPLTGYKRVRRRLFDRPLK